MPSATLAQRLRHLISIESISNATFLNKLRLSITTIGGLVLSPRPSSAARRVQTRQEPMFGRPDHPYRPRPTLSDSLDMITSKLLPSMSHSKGLFTVAHAMAAAEPLTPPPP